MKLSKVFGIVLSLHVGVILLVMFQPSCQTTGSKVKSNEEHGDALPQESADQSFNQAINQSEQAETTKVEETVKPDTFAAPKRPKPGELIVPLEPDSLEVGRAPIIVPQESPSAPLDLKPSDLAIYKVVRGDTLWGIARKNGVSLANLLKANPNLEKNGRLSIGQEIMVPSVQSSSIIEEPASTFTSENSSFSSGNSYVIKSGDTLSQIARIHGLRLSELLKANNMSMSSIIRPGQRLIIPVGLNNTGSGLTSEDQSVPRVVPLGASAHIVKKGENLSRISSIYGVSVAQIMEWNGLSNPSLIREGQSLIVSQGNEPVPAVPVDPVPNTPVDRVSPDRGGTLQDFFNDASSEDRPIIDAP